MSQPDLPLDGNTNAAETPPATAPAVPAEVISELNAMKAELIAYRAEKAAREEEARKAAQQELAKKGQLEEIARNHEAALKARDEAMQAVLNRARKAELRRAITSALSGHELVENAADDLLRLWGDDFEVEDDGDGFKVRSKSDLRSPADVVAERLASKRYAHFVKAANRGGANAGGTKPAPTPGQGEQQNLSPLEKSRLALLQRYKSGVN